MLFCFRTFLENKDGSFNLQNSVEVEKDQFRNLPGKKIRAYELKTFLKVRFTDKFCRISVNFHIYSIASLSFKSTSSTRERRDLKTFQICFFCVRFLSVGWPDKSWTKGTNSIHDWVDSWHFALYEDWRTEDQVWVWSSKKWPVGAENLCSNPPIWWVISHLEDNNILQIENDSWVLCYPQILRWYLDIPIISYIIGKLCYTMYLFQNK